MTKNLNAYATAKGCQIRKVPVIIFIALINRYIWLPTWLTCDYEYRTRKGKVFTQEGFAWYLRHKAARRRMKAIVRERLTKQHLKTA